MNRTSGYIKSTALIMFVMLNKYNMYKNLPLILVSLCFFSCTSKDQNFINKEIETQLKSKENVVNVFLDIKFGMNKHQFDSCISAHVTTGKITIDLDYAYQFNDNSKLKDIKWFIRPELLNDTIIGLSLRAHKDLSSVEEIHLPQVYREIIKEYVLKYGKPNYSFGNYNKYWFIKNLEINIYIIDEWINVDYENTRRRREIDYQKIRVVEDYNLYDAWYYEKMQKDHIHQKKINLDI